MEWIIGLFLLWLISIFTESNKSSKKVESKRRTTDKTSLTVDAGDAELRPVRIKKAIDQDSKISQKLSVELTQPDETTKPPPPPERVALAESPFNVLPALIKEDSEDNSARIQGGNYRFTNIEDDTESTRKSLHAKTGIVTRAPTELDLVYKKNVPKNVEKKITAVAESDKYIVYHREGKNDTWLNFFLHFKKPGAGPHKFELGWNGERFADADGYRKLMAVDSEAVRWIYLILRRKYRKSDSEIQKVVNDLSIPHLIHFTRAGNLDSILRIGIQPRANSALYGFTPRINDEIRLDGHLDATSISIGFPNSRMFFKYRNIFPKENWVVLVLNKSILWERMCMFCRYNAADKRVSSKSLIELGDHRALKGMYDNAESPDSRLEQRLRSFDPTNEQAEVLVFDVIPRSSIDCIVFDSSDLMREYADLAPEIAMRTEASNRGFFSSRSYAIRGG